mmetsp:Transcript_26215/g.91181  ORF Transcript_26215/g.91181 Transcript_26215/m.91181 type:complete len:269 (-) Transcript_26215:402-1208(-)
MPGAAAASEDGLRSRRRHAVHALPSSTCCLPPPQIPPFMCTSRRAAGMCAMGARCRRGRHLLTRDISLGVPSLPPNLASPRTGSCRHGQRRADGRQGREDHRRRRYRHHAGRSPRACHHGCRAHRRCPHRCEPRPRSRQMRHADARSHPARHLTRRSHPADMMAKGPTAPAAVADRPETRAEALRKFGLDASKINIGVTGESGAGKSALINRLRNVKKTPAAVADKTWAPEGAVETTIKPKAYPFPGMPDVVLWDMPGAGTDAFPYET